MNDMILAKVDRAKALLVQCRDAGDAKKVSDMAHAAEIYAKRQRASQETIDYAHGIKVDAMTLLGEFLSRQEMNKGVRMNGKDSIGGAKKEPPKKEIPTLAQSGITKKESALSQKLHKLSKENPERHAAIRSAQEPIQSVFSSAHVSHNSGNNEWYTPKEFIEAAKKVMGGIDLDPANSVEANKVVGAVKFHTEKDSGLKHDWKGRVWMNPPYASELINPFCRKLTESFRSGEVTQALVLVNNSTETAWFQDMCQEASAICFPERRVKFWNPQKISAAPLQGQAVIYFGNKPKDFIARFSSFGLCCEVIESLK